MAIKLASQIKHHHHAQASGHFHSKLNKPQNPSSPREGGNGMKLREYNTKSFSPQWTSHYFISKPYITDMLKNSRQLVIWACSLSPWECCCCCSCSVTKFCPILCNPMDSLQSYGGMLDLPVIHHLPEFAQTQVHLVSDAFQTAHPLSLSASPALSLSQHQGLFQWVGSLHQVAKGLELQLEY